MVYLTSDIHGAFDIHKINPDEFLAGNSLSRKDFVVICGDFGCVWDGGSSDRFWLNWLETLPWTTLFIDGNHENFDVLKTYPEVDYHGGKARRIRSNIFYLMRGEIFHLDGNSYLALGGGFSHDAALRTKGVSWWPEEIFSPSQRENALANLEKADGQVDYILSHDVYKSHPLADTYPVSMDAYGENQIHQQDFLEEIRQKTDYKGWFCGHYHQDHFSLQENRPCFVLYDTVAKVDELMEQKQQALAGVQKTETL